jgi:hypothetical protein
MIHLPTKKGYKMKKITISTVSALTLASSLFVGCGSSSSNDEGGNPVVTTGTLVDPYIVNSVLYQDSNDNKQYDDGELISTPTDVNGKFTFSKELTAGKIIRIKTQGLHEGVTYDLNITGKVTDDKKIAVISPLTTFEARGLTTAQIADILNEAAINANVHFDNDATKAKWSIEASKVSLDPLSGDLMNKTASQLTDSDLVAIQASLTTYGVLKIMDGSSTLRELNATALYDSGMNENGHSEVHDITKSMLSGVVETLNSSLLSDVKDAISSGRTMLTNGGIPSNIANQGLPEPSVKLLVKIAVTIIDRVANIGYTTCNSTNGTDAQKVTAGLSAVSTFYGAHISQTAFMQLGRQLYGMTYHDSMKSTFVAPYGAGLTGILGADAELKIGYDAKEAGKSTIRMKDDGTFEAK